jgi:hypothetical protein
VDDRLLDGTHRLSMVLDPLHSPTNSLRPPIWVRVESAKVDVLQLELSVEVTTVRTIVSPVFRLDVEATLTARGDEMVLVQALDVCAHLIVPSGDRRGSTVLRSRKVAYAVRAAAGFVGELPGEDGRVVLVSGHDCLDVSLESLLDLGQAVELCSSQNVSTTKGSPITNIIVVLPTKVDGVDIHASVISPVVRECHHQLDSGLACGVDNFVKGRHINRRLAVCPALEDDLSASGAFPTILWKPFWDVSDILLVEAPSTEDIQTSLLRSGQAQLDICLVLSSKSGMIVWRRVGYIRC